jgi:hypothetical protein
LSFVSHCDDFEDSVAYAVSLGDDTDTIGAMTGAISGGYHGKGSIPERWLDVLENGERGRDYIEGLAEKLWEIKINKNKSSSFPPQLSCESKKRGAKGDLKTIRILLCKCL